MHAPIKIMVYLREATFYQTHGRSYSSFNFYLGNEDSANTAMLEMLKINYQLPYLLYAFQLLVACDLCLLSILI